LPSDLPIGSLVSKPHNVANVSTKVRKEKQKHPKKIVVSDE